MAMAESSWPSPSYNSGAVSSAEYEALNFYVGGGLMGLYTETAPIFADSSGRQFKIRALRYGNIHGFNWYSGTSDTTVAIAANASGSTRIDRVVLRLTRSTWQVRVAVIAGTPGAGAPAYTQTYSDSGVFEISLALITVANNASTLAAGDCVFHGSYFAPTPMIAPASTSTPVTMNNTARSYVGQTYLDAATGVMRFHSGVGLRQLADAEKIGPSYEPVITKPIIKLILPSAFGVANNSNLVGVPWGTNSELLKSHASMHSTTTNNTRVIGPWAGFYRCTFTPVWAASNAGYRTHTIAKNGVRLAPESGWYQTVPNVTLPLAAVTTIVSMNGTTDYVEAYVFQNSGGVVNLTGDGNVSTTANTIFEVEYIRPLL